MLSSPRGPFRNYRRKSTDLKVSFDKDLTRDLSESNRSDIMSCCSTS